MTIIARRIVWGDVVLLATAGLAWHRLGRGATEPRVSHAQADEATLRQSLPRALAGRWQEELDRIRHPIRQARHLRNQESAVCSG